MTTLPAGPELDRLIAEKVMGWRDLSWNEQHPEDSEECTWMPRRWCERSTAGHWVDKYRSMSDDPEDPTQFWRPSTSIAHAWVVIEKLIAMGVAFPNIRFDKNRRINGCWDCGMSIPDPIKPGQKFIAESADTAPLAICRAALAAMGHK